MKPSLRDYLTPIFVLALLLLLAAVNIFTLNITNAFSLNLLFLSIAGTALIIFLEKKRSHSTQLQLERIEGALAALSSGKRGSRLDINRKHSFSRLASYCNAMADELDLLREKSQVQQKMRLRWLQDLAHDLRIPLASLELAQSSLIENWNLLAEPAKQELVHDSLREIFYLRALVEDLLFLSLLDDPLYFSSKSIVEPQEIVTQILHSYSEQAKRRGKIFTESLFIEKNVRCTLNESLLQRLLKNALDNALFMSASIFEIRIVWKSNLLCIEISNDGEEISEVQVSQFGKRREARKSETQLSRPLSLGLGSTIISKILKHWNASYEIRALRESERSYRGTLLEMKIIMP